MWQEAHSKGMCWCSQLGRNATLPLWCNQPALLFRLPPARPASPVLYLRQACSPLEVPHKQVLHSTVGAAGQEHGDGCTGGGMGGREGGRR